MTKEDTFAVFRALWGRPLLPFYAVELQYGVGSSLHGHKGVVFVFVLLCDDPADVAEHQGSGIDGPRMWQGAARTAYPGPVAVRPLRQRVLGATLPSRNVSTYWLILLSAPMP